MGVNKLDTGSKNLYNGLFKLNSNNDKLLVGIDKILIGTNSINSGAAKLYNGSIKISENLFKLENGSNTLFNSLDNGSKEISNTSLSASSKDMFASPIITEESTNSYIDNTGYIAFHKSNSSKPSFAVKLEKIMD